MRAARRPEWRVQGTRMCFYRCSAKRWRTGWGGACGIGGCGYVGVEAGDGAAAGTDEVFGVALAALGVGGLEGGDGFELAQGFGFFGLRSGVIIQDGFQFGLFPEQAAGSFSLG